MGAWLELPRLSQAELLRQRSLALSVWRVAVSGGAVSSAEASKANETPSAELRRRP